VNLICPASGRRWQSYRDRRLQRTTCRRYSNPLLCTQNRWDKRPPSSYERCVGHSSSRRVASARQFRSQMPYLALQRASRQKLMWKHAQEAASYGARVTLLARSVLVDDMVRLDHIPPEGLLARMLALVESLAMLLPRVVLLSRTSSVRPLFRLLFLTIPAEDWLPASPARVPLAGSCETMSFFLLTSSMRSLIRFLSSTTGIVFLLVRRSSSLCKSQNENRALVLPMTSIGR